jgi:hypothetical protein
LNLASQLGKTIDIQRTQIGGIALMNSKAADIIRSSLRNVAFTVAGISIESGIPPFRGENVLWNKYDPATFYIQYFYDNTKGLWMVIRKIFYDLFGTVKSPTLTTIHWLRWKPIIRLRTSLPRMWII